MCLARHLIENANFPVIFNPISINSGSPFKQWNKGVNLASGDLVWIAETDDSCDPFFLERLLSVYQQNTVDLVWAQSIVIDDDGKKLYSACEWHHHVFPGLFDHDFVMDGDLFVRDHLSSINLIPNASAAVFSREKYIQSGPANELMYYAGDWLQWINLVKGGKVAFVNQGLNYFRCHPSTTRSSPVRRTLKFENLVCILAALTCTNSLTIDFAKASKRIRIKISTILAWRKTKAFSCFLLNYISFIDIHCLNSRIRKSGGLTYFSFGALLILGLFAFNRLLTIRFNALLYRVSNLFGNLNSFFSL